MKILRLISSFRGNESQSFQLGNNIVKKLQKIYPDSSVQIKNLVLEEMPHFNALHFMSFTTPLDFLTPEIRTSMRFSNEAINELTEADIIVIDTPMYNFTIPSSLKAWIDHIVRAGVTFQYTENGVEGLVKNKKVYLSIATGGVYSDGPMKEFDLTEKYLRNILGFIGITDITAFRVEGSAIPALKEQAFPKALQSVETFNF